MSYEPSAPPPSYDKSSSAADQNVQMPPMLGQQQQQQPAQYYPVQTGMNYPVAGPTNYGQPYVQPVAWGPTGPTGMQPNMGYVAVGNPHVIIAQPLAQDDGRPRVSYVKHIVLSCFVVWCCCPIFGLLAFGLAMMAHFSSVSPFQNARTLSRPYSLASIGFSVGGIVLGVIGIIVVVVLINTTYKDCNYYIFQACYKNRRQSSAFAPCEGMHWFDYCYYN